MGMYTEGEDIWVFILSKATFWMLMKLGRLNNGVGRYGVSEGFELFVSDTAVGDGLVIQFLVNHLCSAILEN